MKHFITLLTAAILLLNIANAQNVGQLAPDFSLKTLNNDFYQLSANRGKVILVFLVGYNCPLCIASAPSVKSELLEIYASNSNFEFLVIDTWNGSSTSVNSFKNNTGLNAIYLQQGGSVATSWTTSYDRLVVIDSEGKMAFKGTKAARSDVNSAKNVIENALKNITTSTFDLEENNPVSLGQNFPNPIINKTTIEFSIANPGTVILKVINIAGKEVATLINGDLQAGKHLVEFKTDQIPNGIYFYQLNAGNFSATNKMIVNK